ncbi:CBS domain-containing protein [Nonomuraea sp. NPDC005650]|uniref:CBS domain-containing protein n=1 Tax=Nonomuraea sp. NPDC005650 TaxID=3157045 RepID=UPI0033B20C8A
MGTSGLGKTVQDVMHRGAQCIGEHDSLRTASQMMRDLSVGALPICGDDDRLKGIITDRDIVIKCCAEGKDIDRTTASELARGLVWVDARSSVEEALQKMEQHQIKRLPVIENHRIAGMVTEADLAKELPDNKLAEFVHRVYASA